MRWKVLFVMENKAATLEELQKETDGFKSKYHPSQSKYLSAFGKDLFNIASSNFQQIMKEDITQIKSSHDVFIFADTTNNLYKSSPEEYKKLLFNNITKSYRKSTKRLEKAINMEAKHI